MVTTYEDSDGDGIIETDPNQTGMIRVTGTGNNEVITATSSNASGQIHVYAGGGEDIINMDFSNTGAFQKGHHVRGDNNGGSVRAADTFNFQNYSGVTGIIVGRIEDFDYSRDTIMIDGVAVDLKGSLPNNVRVVQYDSNPNDSATEMQQWLLIDTGSGFLFYALEGARVITSGYGANGNQLEDHFINYERDANGDRIRDNNGNIVPSVTEATLQDLFDNHAVDYIEHNNYVPDGYTAQGGNVINDYDSIPTDVSDVVGGSGNGDLIAAGLNDDVVNANGGNDYVWGGSGNDTINGGAGDDTLEGGTGDDVLNGGTGADTFTFSVGHGNDTITNFDASEDLITYNGQIVDLENPGNGISRTMVGADLVVTLGSGSVATVVTILDYVTPMNPDPDDRVYATSTDGTEGADKDNSSGNNALRGTSVDEEIFGLGGNDAIYGGGGNDRLIDGMGKDTLYGEDGSDIFVFEAGDNQMDTVYDFQSTIDFIDLRAWGVSDFAQLQISTNNNNGQQIVTFGSESISVRFDGGSSGTLIADDFLLGDGGGQPDPDPDPEVNPDDRVYATSTDGTEGADKDNSSGNNALRGTSVDEEIFGLGGNDAIYGGGGNDRLIDGMGKDTLYGEDGSDIFVFEAGDNQMDTVYDFQSTIDFIDLRAWGVSDFAQLQISTNNNNGQQIVTFGSESISVRFDGGSSGTLIADDFLLG